MHVLVSDKMAVDKDQRLVSTILLHLMYIAAIYGDQGSNTDHELNVCYAKELFPSCRDGTKMVILDLKYGVKTPSNNCPAQTTMHQNVSCCSYKQGDCLVPMLDYIDIHRYYAAFSARKEPLYQPRAEWRRIDPEKDNCTVGRSFSNFVLIDYRCISDAVTIDMTTDGTLTSQFVSTIYPVFGGEGAREVSSCTISSGQSGLVISALDIRLECYTGNENDTCTGNHSLTFMDGNQNKTFFSMEDTILAEYQVIFSTVESSIKFLFERDNGSRPQMVWFGVHGKENTATVTISCNEPEEVSTTPNLVSTMRPTASNNTQSDNESDNLLPIVIGVSGGAVFVFLVIGVCVYRSRRNRSDKQKVEAFNDYRRKLQQQNLEMKPGRVPAGDKSKPDKQQRRVKDEQKGRKQDVTDQQRRRKMNINSPKGLELSMHDPVYHDVAISSRPPRPKTTEDNKYKRNH